MNWGVLQRPPYNTDLSPCDYRVFDTLKELLKRGRFNSGVDIEFAVR